MPTRAQLVAAINTFRGRTPVNPIDDDELASFLQGWLDYYDQNGAFNPSDVQLLIAQNTALQNNLVARSLSLFATIYVDGVNGNDARIGTTRNNDPATGCVKTLARVAQLHNDKTKTLYIVFVNNTDINSDVTFYVPDMHFVQDGGCTVTIRKKPIYDPNGVQIGEGPYVTKFFSTQVNWQVYIGATLTIEAHAGSTGAGLQAYYTSYQGAFQMGQSRSLMSSDLFQVFNLCINHNSTFNLGANQTLITPGPDGYYEVSWNLLARYKRVLSGTTTVNIGANATESVCVGDRTLLRAYHPTSSTDAKVREGEMVISTTNNDLYFKRNGTIRRVTTAAYS